MVNLGMRHNPWDLRQNTRVTPMELLAGAESRNAAIFAALLYY